MFLVYLVIGALHMFFDDDDDDVLAVAASLTTEFRWTVLFLSNCHLSPCSHPTAFEGFIFKKNGRYGEQLLKKC